MEMKSLSWKSRFFIVAILLFLLGCTHMQPPPAATKAPVITHSYAIEKGRYGDALRIYIEALSDIDPEALHLGIVEIIKTSRWMPKVSEIREAARAAMESQESQLVMQWHDDRNKGLWHNVMSWDYEGGARRPVELDWHICPKCGVKYANWNACPDCVKVEA